MPDVPNISPSGGLSKIEVKRTFRDILVFFLGALIPVAIETLNFIPTLDWGVYGPLVGVLAGGLAQYKVLLISTSRARRNSVILRVGCLITIVEA